MIMSTDEETFQHSSDHYGARIPHLFDLFVEWVCENSDVVIKSGIFAIMFLFAAQVLTTIKDILIYHKTGILILFSMTYLAVLVICRYYEEELGVGELWGHALQLSFTLMSSGIGLFSALQLLDLTLDHPIAVGKSYLMLFCIIFILLQFPEDVVFSINKDHKKVQGIRA